MKKSSVEKMLSGPARDLAFVDFPELSGAVLEALARHRLLRAEYGALLALDENTLCQEVQSSFLNFYPAPSIMPYVPLSARGAWIVTTHGAVMHDSAGYGMLGLGHAPEALIECMAEPWPMANVMTPSLSQHRFAGRLRAEIGHTRGGCPFARFVCLNSGSEAMSLAARLSDLNAYRLTAEGARHHGKTIKILSLAESFHGRTYRPARASDSTAKLYAENLASFRGREDLIVVAANDCEALQRAYDQAIEENVFIEAFFLEPVLGEGRPGEALHRDFYDLAHRLSRREGSLLIVDSIQAALRAHGCLSIIDYPEFQDCAPPDIESYSKALNAGQYPLSVLALQESVAELYVVGAYGNTMTTNPRALEVGCAVLDAIDESLRDNIRTRGRELKEGLEALALEFPKAVLSVTGTGLMVAAELNPDRYPVVADEGFETTLRRNGITMIHGGTNALRFTPHFGIRVEEIQLILRMIRRGIEALS